MRTFRSRTVVAAVVVVAVVLTGLDVFVYLSLRHELQEGTAEVQDEQLDRASADGAEVEVESARPDVSPEGSRRVLELARLLLISGTALGIGLAAVLIERWLARETRPLAEFVSAARRVAAGERGVRLHPARVDTELGQVSAALDEVTEALEAAVDEARRTSDVTEAFLADAAHQLRTPITGIRASAEALALGLAPQDHARTIDLLVGESERAAMLLAGLLRLAKLDLGETPQEHLVDLTEVARHEVERIQSTTRALRVTLVDDLGTAAPIELDPMAVGEALANVLDNARRHARARIDVHLAVVGPDIEIRVSDDGPGMAPQDAARAFDRFVCLDGAGGSGLGLPIARAIVEAHGGELVYVDRRFVIRLARERRHRSRAGGHDGVSATGPERQHPVLAGRRSGSGRRHDRSTGDARSDR